MRERDWMTWQRNSKAAGIDTKPHVYVGDPETEILKAAKEYQASMIIIGSSERNAILERWMGSISRNIADKSHLPMSAFSGGKSKKNVSV